MKNNTTSALPIVLMALSFIIGVGLVACMKVGDGIGVDEYGAPLIVVVTPVDSCTLPVKPARCIVLVDSCTLATKPARCTTVAVDSCTLPVKPARCTPPTGPSFAKDILPIITTSCEECHKSTGTAASTKLFLIPDSAYVNLVNVRSTGSKTANYMRVVPGKADSSFMYLKISMAEPPGDGVRMPQLRAPLKADKIELIKNWINAGALP